MESVGLPPLYGRIRHKLELVALCLLFQRNGPRIGKLAECLPFPEKLAQTMESSAVPSFSERNGSLTMEIGGVPFCPGEMEQTTVIDA